MKAGLITVTLMACMAAVPRSAGRRPRAAITNVEKAKKTAAARELIARKGSDQVKMSEIAARAAISIGSLYQYFPEKAAIVRALAERYSAESRKCIEAALSGVRDRAGLRAAYEGLLDQYYA